MSGDVEQETITDHDHQPVVDERRTTDAGDVYVVEECADDDCGWWRSSLESEQRDLDGWSA